MKYLYAFASQQSLRTCELCRVVAVVAHSAHIHAKNMLHMFNIKLSFFHVRWRVMICFFYTFHHHQNDISVILQPRPEQYLPSLLYLFVELGCVKFVARVFFCVCIFAIQFHDVCNFSHYSTNQPSVAFRTSVCTFSKYILEHLWFMDILIRMSRAFMCEYVKTSYNDFFSRARAHSTVYSRLVHWRWCCTKRI